jgi:hypothetical protein
MIIPFVPLFPFVPSSLPVFLSQAGLYLTQPQQKFDAVDKRKLVDKDRQ